MLHIKWKIAKYFITCDKNFYVKVVYRKKHIKHQTVFIYVCVFIISYLLPTFPCKNMQYSTLSTMNIGPKIENLISSLAAACFQWVRASLNSKSHHNSTLAPSAHDASYWKSELILNYTVLWAKLLIQSAFSATYNLPHLKLLTSLTWEKERQ